MLASAAPLADTEPTFHTTKNVVAYGTGGGVVGLIVLILDVLVFSMLKCASGVLPLLVWVVKLTSIIVEVLKSNRPPSHKILWCLIVFLFPILGMLIYFLFSNREAHKAGGSYEPLP